MIIEWRQLFQALTKPVLVVEVNCSPKYLNCENIGFQFTGTEETKKAETKPGGAENCRRRGKGSKNKKNKRDKKNKKPRLTEDNEWWYRDIPLVRSPSLVVRQPASSWKLPHSRPIIKTVCSKTLCMIRPYGYGIYPNSPPSHVCTKLDMKYCKHVGFLLKFIPCLIFEIEAWWWNQLVERHHSCPKLNNVKSLWTERRTQFSSSFYLLIESKWFALELGSTEVVKIRIWTFISWWGRVEWFWKIVSCKHNCTRKKKKTQWVGHAMTRNLPV